MSMAMELLLAKPVMENEEGLNHLWIRWDGLHGSEERFQLIRSSAANIRVELPDGIHRSINLNGYVEEDKDGERQIAIDLTLAHDVLLELYTESAVPYSEAEIMATLTIGDQKVRSSVTLHLTDADALETPVVNEQVVERLKQLQALDDDAGLDMSKEAFVSIPPRWVERRVNEYDFLTERYRIDCGGKGRQA